MISMARGWGMGTLLSPLRWQAQSGLPLIVCHPWHGEVKQRPLGATRELTPCLGEVPAALAIVPKSFQP